MSDRGADARPASTDPSSSTAVHEWSGSYLPMDCPNCGRQRLYVWLDDKGALRMECDKCEATGFACDEAAHEQSGPHPQRATYDRPAGG